MSKLADESKSFGTFLRDCRAEIGKISWPSRKQLIGSTWVVAALIVLLSLFILITDGILGAIVGLITGSGV